MIIRNYVKTKDTFLKKFMDPIWQVKLKWLYLWLEASQIPLCWVINLIFLPDTYFFNSNWFFTYYFPPKIADWLNSINPRYLRARRGEISCEMPVHMKFPPNKICLLCGGARGEISCEIPVHMKFPPNKICLLCGGRGEISCEIPVHMKFPPNKICLLCGRGARGEISCEIPVHMKFPP